MTAQFGEKLIYEGERVSMFSEPLRDYFAQCGHQPEFELTYTALWRGYVGTWEIADNRLYIIGLTGTLKDGTDADLATVFPGHPDRVFAQWYSGTLRIPEGKPITYVHMGFESTYERDRLITIENGIVTGVEVVENSLCSPDAGDEEDEEEEDDAGNDHW